MLDNELKKLGILSICIILLIILCPGCNSSDIILHETPQTYVLTGEESFSVMPTVILYENGNARLSQPMISSFALIGIGYYDVKGKEIFITHGKNSNATFTISDDGDTLTLKSSNLGFTKVGTVYKYRSQKEYLSRYDKIDGEKLTLEILQELAEKA